jgi:hypothetical protein
VNVKNGLEIKRRFLDPRVVYSFTSCVHKLTTPPEEEL